MLIDGPALCPEVELSCDLIRLAPRLNRGAFGMIDHRWRTAVLAQEHARHLRLRYVPSLESFVFRTTDG